MAKIFAPAAENAAIKQVTAPAAATSNAAPAAEQKEPQTNPTSRRRAPSAPIWSALTVARRMFNNLPSALQNTETKRMCLKEAAERTYGDPKRASYDIKNEARKLTNLMDFGEYCRKNGLKGENVAEHVVFEGKTVMRRVMEYGVESVLGTKIQIFAEPLTDGKEKSTESEANAE
ncbi:hypothetical protein [Alistipes communis]|uniref:hypothetical protein n=1 Tax=Alistipes communis TaxID=2585118 RepID=UPI003077BE58